MPKGKRYTVDINIDYCKGCGFCINFCRKKVLSMSEEYSHRGYHFPQINNSYCSGCKECEFICPDFAIRVSKG